MFCLFKNDASVTFFQNVSLVTLFELEIFHVKSRSSWFWVFIFQFSLCMDYCRGNFLTYDVHIRDGGVMLLHIQEQKPRLPKK